MPRGQTGQTAFPPQHLFAPAVLAVCAPGLGLVVRMDEDEALGRARGRPRAGRSGGWLGPMSGPRPGQRGNASARRPARDVPARCASGTVGPADKPQRSAYALGKAGRALETDGCGQRRAQGARGHRSLWGGGSLRGGRQRGLATVARCARCDTRVSRGRRGEGRLLAPSPTAQTGGSARRRTAPLVGAQLPSESVCSPL